MIWTLTTDHFIFKEHQLQHSCVWWQGYISQPHISTTQDLLRDPFYQSVWELFWRIPSLLKEEDLFSSQQMLSSGKLTVNEKWMNSVANTKKKKRIWYSLQTEYAQQVLNTL